MKPIKFDLPLNGARVGTLEQLKNNLSAEILEPFRSGRLAKWLRVRNLTEQVDAVDALLAADTEHEEQLLKSLYELFGGEISDDLIRAALTERTKSSPFLSQKSCDMEIEIEIEIEAVKAEFAKKELEYQQKIKRLKNLRIDQFIANHDGTAEDTATGLIWCRYAVGQRWENGTTVGKATQMTWNEAIQAAKSQTGSWRLPTLEELEGLTEKDKSPAINQSVFVKTPQIGFWSSSPHDSDNNYVYTIDFSNGCSDYNHTDQSYAVRLVREKSDPFGILTNLFKLLFG